MKRILFSANDPGGANALAPVIAALNARGDQCEGYLTGPARAIFARAEIPFIDAEGLSHEDVGKRIGAFAPHAYTAARSMGIQLDKYILLMVHTQGVPSVYVLDFWSDYQESVGGNNDPFFYLPYAYCVMDARARDEMLAEGFPPESLRVTGNPYFEQCADGITRDRENSHEILFISQPIRSDHGDLYGFDEFSVLEGLIEALSAMPEYYISVRLHPRDELGKFDTYLSDRVILSTAKTLEEALSGAGLVISPFSQVLIQAVAAGKAVISFQPNAKGSDPLPTNRVGITKKASTVTELRDLLSQYRAGTFPTMAVDLEKLWPKGAAGRIVAVIDSFIK